MYTAVKGGKTFSIEEKDVKIYESAGWKVKPETTAEPAADSVPDSGGSENPGTGAGGESGTDTGADSGKDTSKTAKK